MKLPEDMIDEGSAKYLHKIVQTKEPKEIYDMIKFPRSRDTCDLSLHYAPKTDRMKRCSIVAGIRNFNRIPNEIRNLNPVKVKKKLKIKRLNVNRNI